MAFQLETLPYQQATIASVVKVNKVTNSIDDKSALTESEREKIRCAIKHFEALGVEVQYIAPVKEYDSFKSNIKIAQLV